MTAAGAHETAEVLREAAALVDDVAQQRATSARRARVGWTGPLRARFDAERARRDATAAELAARCRRLAAALDEEPMG